MTVLLTSLLLFQTGYTKPAGWIDQKIGDSMTVSAPRTLKKEPMDPKDKESGYVWDDVSGPVHYGVTIDKPDPKTTKSASESITEFCEELIATADGTLDDERDLLSQGWRGISATARTDDHKTIVIRGYYYRDRMVSVYANFDSRSKRPESVDQFLNSLRFGANGAATSAAPDFSRCTFGKTGISALVPLPPESDLKPGKQIVFSYSADYCGVGWSIKGINLPADQSSYQGHAELDFCGGFLESYLKDEKDKPTDKKEITVGIEQGMRSNYDAEEHTGGSVAIVRHGKQLLIIEVSGPRPYLTSETMDAFFKSIQFADEPPGTVPPQTSDVWTDQTFGDGVKISAPRKLKKEPPDKDPDLAKTLQEWSADDGEVNYQLQYVKSKETAEQSVAILLTSFVKGAVEEVKGTIDGEKDLLLQGWPGLALTLVTKDGATVVMRAYLVDGSMVSTAVGYPTADGRPASVDKYLDSIHFPKDGTLTSVGPAMARYPLGGSGISALFPMKPVARDTPVKNKSKLTGVTVHVFVGVYGGRVYTIGYMDFPIKTPDPTARDITDFYNDEMDDLCDEIKAKTTKQKDLAFGDNMGLYREFSMKEGTGSVAIVYRKRQGIFFFVYGPKAYKEQASIDAFFKSLEFKN